MRIVIYREGIKFFEYIIVIFGLKGDRVVRIKNGIVSVGNFENYRYDKGKGQWEAIVTLEWKDLVELIKRL